MDMCTDMCTDMCLQSVGEVVVALGGIRPHDTLDCEGHDTEDHLGHNYIGHYYIGHHYIGHHYIGHYYIGHNYIGHYYIGHNYIGHYYIGHNYMQDTLDCEGHGTEDHLSRPSPTACLLRGYGRVGTQNDRLGKGVVLFIGAPILVQ